MKKLFIITFFLASTLGCNLKSNKTGNMPVEVKNHIDLNMPGYTIITRDMLTRDIIVYTKDSAQVALEGYFTDDKDLDYVCMLRDVDSIPYLIAFNNYKRNIHPIVIDGVADYGPFNIGTYLFKGEKDGFYSHKFGSSLAYIYWDDNKYKIEYITD